MQEVGCVVVLGVWWNATDVIVCLWCCPGHAVLQVMFVDFWWSVEISWTTGLLEEQDGAVVGVFWTLPSGQLPVH